MDAAPRAPVLDLLASGEAVYKESGDLRRLIQFAGVTLVWLILTFVLFILSAVLEPDTWGPLSDLSFASMALGAIFLGFIAIFVVPTFRRSRQALDDLLDNFVPLWWKTRFELLPASGQTTVERLWNKILGIDEKLQKAKVQIPAKVKGRKGEHNFDLFASNGSRIAVFLRIFDKTVKATDVQAIKEAFGDIRKKSSWNRKIFVIASRSGFDDVVLQELESEANPVGPGVMVAYLDIIDEEFRVRSIRATSF